MRLSQYYFTRKFFKLNENAFDSKNPKIYLTKQLATYYYWWGYQNLYQQKIIINGNSFSIKKNIFFYQI